MDGDYPDFEASIFDRGGDSWVWLIKPLPEGHEDFYIETHPNPVYGELVESVRAGFDIERSVQHTRRIREELDRGIV